ncbi:MAG: VOC family protein [Actinomycetota bacterium]|nr:VOC family protein [Actinomycetota bacterium]
MSPTIIPYLLYEDVAAALDFLSRAFGFREHLRLTGSQGYVNHAEMRLGDSMIFLGDPGDDYRNPKRLGQETVDLYVQVDDVDAHYERAKAAGAEIVEEPQDQPYGDRRYGAVDQEGHRWFFAQPVADVAPEQWGAEVATP